MRKKTYRTFVLPSALDDQLRERSRASGKSVSRYIFEAVEGIMELDQASLGRISAIASALGVKPGCVINNLVKTRLAEIEERRRQHDPAALVLASYLELGESAAS